MANQFVSEIVRLSGRMNPTWGQIAILLKNGRPERVYLPGERLSRGINAPLFGVLDIVHVQTEAEAVTLKFDDVITKNNNEYAIEGYSIPSLRLDLRVRINSSKGYEKFKSHINSHGPRFAEALIEEISNGLNSRIRSRMLQKTVAELRASSLSDVLGASQTPFTFGSEALQVTSLVASVERWPDVYETLVDTTQRTIVGVAQHESETIVGAAEIAKSRALELGTVANEALVLEERINLLSPAAAQLGVLRCVKDLRQLVSFFWVRQQRVVVGLVC